MTDTPASSPPWWRLPIVWLVIGGPAAVVLASFATLGLALSHPDPVLDTPAAVAPSQSRSQAPAMQARNHAATPER
jgi:hypothetical protein